MKYELDGKIMTEFAALRARTYSHLTIDNGENKRAKDTKRAPQNKNLNSKIIKIVWRQLDLKMK